MGKKKHAQRLGEDIANQNKGDAGPPPVDHQTQDATPEVGGHAPEANAFRPGFWQEVTIDKHTFDVNYGTKDVFERLMEECSRSAATMVPRPGQPSRNFFQCIHCGKANFTNKMRLNSHRFHSQCPAMKDVMGNPKRLLPYPDQGVGRGKVSEAIRKGKTLQDLRDKFKEDFDKKWAKRAERASTKVAEDDMEEARPTSTRSTAKGVDNEGRPTRIEYTTAPATVSGLEAAASEERAEPLGRDELGDGRQGKGSNGGKARPKMLLEVRVVKERPQRKAGGRKTMDAGAGTAKEVKDNNMSKACEAPVNAASERIGRIPEVANGAGGQESFKVIQRLQRGSSTVEASFPAGPPPEQGSPPRPTGDKATAPHLLEAIAKKTTVGVPTEKRNSRRQGAHSDEEPKMREETGIHKRKVSSSSDEVLAALRTPVRKRNKGDVTQPLRSRRRRLLDSPTRGEAEVDVSGAPPNAGIPDWNDAGDDDHGPDDQGYASANDPLETLSRAAEMDAEMKRAINALDNMLVGSKEQLTQTPAASPPRSSPRQRSPVPMMASVETTASPKPLPLVRWTGHYEGNHALHRYWMCGIGTPKVKVYHPGLATSTLGRAERLRRDEREVREAARVKANELAWNRKVPDPPHEVEVPNMYYLLQIKPDFFGWKWEGLSAQEFKRRFAESWVDQKFQSATRECGMWWLCEAKEEDYPNICKAIGRAVNSLCQGVKYGIVPADIDLMAKYLQYVQDKARYEEDQRTAASTLLAEQNRIVQDAVANFRQQTRMAREAAIWDWCPLWHVLVGKKEILDNLPPMPWRHDDDEATQVRDFLLAARFLRQKPPAFVQVLRIVLQNVYGRWRQMTCPSFGLSKSLVRTLCRRQRDIMLALSIYTFEAPFRFSGMESFEFDVVHTAVMKDAQLVSENKGDRVLDNIIAWMQNVRLRALQDLAREHPEAFRRCWTTTLHEHWGEQSKFWSRCLRLREDLDMGWVLDEAQPKWASRVKAVKAEILKLVQTMETALDEDEKAVWADFHAASVQCSAPAVDKTLPAAQDIPQPQSSLDPLTMSQMQRAVQIDDIATQDLDVQGLPETSTPAGMVGLVCKESSVGEFSFQVPPAKPRNLALEFAPFQSTAEDSDAKSGEDSDGRPYETNDIAVVDPESARRLLHRKSVTFAGPNKLNLDSKAWCRLSIAKTYDYFNVEALMEALPKKGAGDRDSGNINFFGGEWDCLPVPVSQLRQLKRMKKYVGQNVLELLSRRLWWSLSDEVRVQVYIASSFMQGPLNGAWEAKSEVALVKWGQEYLVPSRFCSECPSNFEVLVPYVDAGHWSVFVFTAVKVLHMDSAGLHTTARDKEYVSRIWHIWELLHGRKPGVPPEIEVVRTFTQAGNYECGFCVLRFMELYIRLLHSEEPIADKLKAREIFDSQVRAVVHARDMQKHVIVAVADELGDSTISMPYEPPFRMFYCVDPSESSLSVRSSPLADGDDAVDSAVA